MGIASVIDTFMGAVGMVAKKAMSSHNFLETCDGETLIAKDGSLATIVRIDGTRQMMGTDELNNLVVRANTNLSPYLARPGHAIQVWFARDPDLSQDLMKTMMTPARTVSKRLGIDLEDVFGEREKVLPRFVVHEQFYMVLWTRLSVLSPQELKKIGATTKPPPLWPAMGDSHNLFSVARQVTVRHQSFVTNFLADLRALGLRAEALEGHDALKAVKGTIYPDIIGADWKPYLPGDIGEDPLRKGKDGRPGERVPFARTPQGSDNDMSHLLWPRLDEQLFDRDCTVINSQIVRVGRYYFAGTDMTMGPQDLMPFSALLQRMLEIDEFPWRASFLIEGGGLGAMAMKSFIAAIVGFTNSENKLIRDAVKALNAYEKNGGIVTKLRVSFATWAKADTTVTRKRDAKGAVVEETVSDNIALIEERANRLQRAVESWGYCGVSPSAGDPLSGAFSSALGLDVRSTAPVGAAPLEDVIWMLPWNRDASPFKFGSVLFRTPDRRPWPFQPGSSQQDTFIDIIYAPPGKGKSVYLNTVNLAFCLSPMATSGSGGSQLPRVAIIDIGPSSSGLISLLKEALPPNRRHEVEYRRLRMIKEHAINPFDTQLGCRKPLPLERSFLVNFICLLGTEPGQPTPPGLANLAGMAIDELYEKFSDKAKRGVPRHYVAGEDLQVDEGIRRYAIEIEEEQTWWGLVDKLFARGAMREAALAQRHAVPRVEDLMVIRTPQIMDVFGTAKTPTGEPLVDVFQRVVSSSLREYPILTMPTKFDLGEARVVSLDIDEAAPRGGAAADKQTSLVYMLARFVMARDFYLNEETLGLFPEDYRKFQEKRIRRIRETPKRIVMDEFHRTKSSPIIRDQVKIDMREGRKWGVQVALASQLLDDFDPEMISMATGFWLMGVNAEADADKAADMFGLSKTAKSVLIHALRGPGPGGAPFLAILQMKDGRHEHMLVNTLGPMELWAFSTTAEDVGLRNRLYNSLGPGEARRRLAKRFPKGTAKDEIERRVVIRAERGDTGTEASDGVIEELSKEILSMAA
jgi:intracellular multiplication protein IcmB